MNRKKPSRRAAPEEDEEQMFVERMLALTVRLTRTAMSFPPDLEMASGVIVPRGSELLVLTAGHIFGGSGPWTLEVKFPGHGTGLYVPLREVRRVATLDSMGGRGQAIDVAWGAIDSADVAQALAEHPTLAGQEVELPVYRGSFDGAPKSLAVYGYASWNRVDIHQSPAIRAGDATWETHMRFCEVRPSDNLYELAVASAGHGEDHYRGASGAPIADETGQIVALVLEGDPARGRLIGVPLGVFGAVIERG